MQIRLGLELLFSIISIIEILNEMHKEFIKIRLKDSVFISFQSFNLNNEINLTKNNQLLSGL